MAFFDHTRRPWLLGALPLVLVACGGATSQSVTTMDSGTPDDGSPAPSTDASLDSGTAYDAPTGTAPDAPTGTADAAEGGPAVDAPSGAVDSGDGGLPVDAGGDSPVDAAPSCLPGTCVVSFASGPDWLSYAGTVSSTGSTYSLSQLLGTAIDVCLNVSDPPSCPGSAFLYGYGTSPAAWTGGQTIAGAQWIWRPDVALTSVAPLQVAIFEKTFVVGANATGSVRVAADDFAAVFVNDIAIGALGSTSDVNVAGPAHTTSTQFNLTPALQTGANRIVIAAQNGPFGCSSSPCPYSEDPAAVVFGGTLNY